MNDKNHLYKNAKPRGNPGLFFVLLDGVAAAMSSLRVGAVTQVKIGVLPPFFFDFFCFFVEIPNFASVKQPINK